MKKIKKTLSFSALILFIFLCLGGCMSFRKSNQKYEVDFKKSSINAQVESDTFKQKKFRYVQLIKDANAPNLIFIHGAPGSSSAFTDYLKIEKINASFNIFILDRLGYGYSDYGNEATISEQAKLIQHFAENKQLTNIILIGHSFGGPIAALAAIYLKEKTLGTVMIAPAIDPDNEKFIWGGKLAYWKATNWLFSKAWRVSAKEKYHHVAQLRELESEWSQLKTPILHIHGTTDKLAPIENLEYSQKTFDTTIFTSKSMKGKGHLIPFTEREQCVEMIIDFIQKNI